MILHSLFIIPASVYAASSPWTQTNWNGGSGQTSWSDATKYDSSSSVTTSTANQVTLTQTSSWYNASWAYRKKITFDNSAQAENLTNFPVLVKLSSSNFDFTKAQSAGQDIRFTDSDGTTALSYEIESWDNSGQTANVWVKVPQIDLSSATDNIYMYYGNSSATDDQAATSVWDSSFQGVWHLKETGNGTAGEYNDSTSNNNDGQGGGGTSSNVPTLISSGQVNGAQDLDGTDDYVSMGDVLDMGTSDWTASVWFKTTDNNFNLISKSFYGSGDGRYFMAYQTGKLILGLAPPGLGHIETAWTTTSILDNGWHNAVGVWDRDGNQTLYVDGVQRASTSISSQSSTDYQSSYHLFFGRYNDNVTGTNPHPTELKLDGLMDEVRISNTASSAAYIAASYKSEANTFNTFASEEQEYPASGTLTSSIFDTEFSAGAAWGTLTYTSSGSTVAVKVRTSNSSSMTGATDFSSCTAITSASDISSNSCVTDGHRYIQYQLALSTSDTLSTPTFSDISIAFATYDDTGPTLNLDSPGDNSYTNSERPSFKWKQATDAVSTVSDYDLIVDNGESGDFTISDIPLSRTSDYETNKYTVKYDGFSDSDSDNNYISVYTKSHSDWGTSENDGKLKEGKRSWTVKTTDSVGNSTTSTRTLFVDRTNPSVEFTQVNSTPFSTSSNSNFSTTSKKPTIFGKITDILAGEQKAASGAKNVEIKLEKKNALGGYELHTLTTLNFNENYFISDNLKITDNSKQTSDKYIPFEYIPKEDLTLGTYRVTITGKDNADNAGSPTSFTLNITTLSKITTTEEKKIIEEEIRKLGQAIGSEAQARRDDNLNEEQQEQIKQGLEITKPTEEVPKSVIEKAGEGITQTTNILFERSRELLTDGTSRLTSFARSITEGVASAVAFIFNKTGEDLAFKWSMTEQGLSFTYYVIASASEAISNTEKIATLRLSDSVESLRVNFLAMTNSIGHGYNNLANSAPGVTKNILLAVGNGVSTVGTGIGNGFGAVGTTSNNIADGTSSVIASGSEAISNTGKIATSSVRDGLLAMTKGAQNGITSIAFAVGEKVQDVSGTVGIAIIKFTYNFVPEPTKISDVKVLVLSPTSVKVSWLTNHPANGKVNYGFGSGDYAFEQQTDKRTTAHEFVINNLTPDTEYHYEVMSQNKNYVYDANREFKTPKEK